MKNIPSNVYDEIPYIPEVKVIDTCQMCEADILEHEVYYDVCGVILCAECIEDCKRPLEEDED